MPGLCMGIKSRPSIDGSNHLSSASRGSMTGCRLWISSVPGAASVVMRVHVIPRPPVPETRECDRTMARPDSVRLPDAAFLVPLDKRRRWNDAVLIPQRPSERRAPGQCFSAHVEHRIAAVAGWHESGACRRQTGLAIRPHRTRRDVNSRRPV
jgi:hypothetical protein